MGITEMDANALRKARTWAPGMLLLAAGCLASLWGFSEMRAREELNIRGEFKQAADDFIALLDRETAADLQYIRGAQGLAVGHEDVARDEFRDYVALCLSGKDSIRAIEWVPRVAQSRREEVETAQRSAGLAGFQIAEKDADNNLIRASERPEYFPILYAEPARSNERALGYDLGSEPMRLNVLCEARDTGQMRASAPLRLVQETESAVGILVFAPVYRRGTPTETLEQRRENLKGFVVGVLRVPDVVAEALGGKDQRGMGLCLLDATTPARPMVLYRCQSEWHATGMEPGADEERFWTHQGVVSVAGRQWEVHVHVPEEYLSARRKAGPWLLLGGGLTTSVLLGGYLSLLVGRMARSRAVAARAIADRNALELEVAERQKAQARSEALQQRIEFILEAADTRLDIIDGQFDIRYVDPGFQKVYGDPTGRKCYEYFMGRDEPCPGCGVVTALRTGRKTITEEVLVRENNRRIQVTTLPFQDENGEWVVAEVNVDITERKWAEEELRRSYEMQTLLNRLLALSLEDLSLRETLDRFLRILMEATWIRILPKGAILLVDERGTELTLATQQGLDAPLLDICARVPFGKCLCGRAAAAGRPVFAEHVDDRHEHRYDGMEDHGHCCVPILSSESRILGVLTLYMEAGRQRQKIEVDFLDAVAKVLAALIERKQATESLKASGRSLAQLNRRLQDNQSLLVQSEKMASIGQLAAGVAHEINNPVGFIQSNLTALKEYVATIVGVIAGREELQSAVRRGDRLEVERLLSRTEDPGAREDLAYIRQDVGNLLDESIEGTARIRDIVQSLKSFSRIDDAQVKEADLNQCVETTLKVVWNELKYKCELTKNLAEVPPIRCYPGQINQVIMNLLVNAAQAIPDHGRVTVETGTDDGFVFLSVSDTGVGILPENLPRLFELFFTTKEVGMGTGLGLAVSYGIVQKHGGTIDVRSEVGKGSTFTVRLPLQGIPRDAEDSPMRR